MRPTPRWARAVLVESIVGQGHGSTTYRSALPARYRCGRFKLVAEPSARVDMRGLVFDHSKRRCRGANLDSPPPASPPRTTWNAASAAISICAPRGRMPLPFDVPVRCTREPFDFSSAVTLMPLPLRW